jgi:hypothetical protein
MILVFVRTDQKLRSRARGFPQDRLGSFYRDLRSEVLNSTVGAD